MVSAPVQLPRMPFTASWVFGGFPCLHDVAGIVFGGFGKLPDHLCVGLGLLVQALDELLQLSDFPIPGLVRCLLFHPDCAEVLPPAVTASAFSLFHLPIVARSSLQPIVSISARLRLPVSKLAVLAVLGGTLTLFDGGVLIGGR